MKKYLIPIIILGIVGIGIFIAYQIVTPARAAARDLTAINSLIIGQTSEAELLGRSTFQTAALNCAEGFCIYSTDRENKLLSTFHLAPRTRFSTRVMVRDGVVSEVFVIMSSQGLAPIVVAQAMKLRAECTADPCVKRPLPSYKYVRNISIVFSNESEFRNRWPQMLNAGCLSRMRGCTTYDELVPLAKELNL
jgi:hypothetical protein